MDNGIEVRFTLEFYDEARLDGLSKLVMDPLYMMEYFQKRMDFLYFRHVIFAERGNSDAPFRDIVVSIWPSFESSVVARLSHYQPGLS